ncbi:MAG: toluene hydroxylase [Herpetosiphon sp.]
MTTTPSTTKAPNARRAAAAAALEGPAINVTNAFAGAAEFAGSDSRNYNYFKPKARKASNYEDVTVDVQPDPKRHLLQGWIYAFADGMPSYTEEWTKLKSSDWHVFRDPNEEWDRTFYIRQANTVRQYQQNMAVTASVNAFNYWDKSWIKAIESHVSVLMHPEYGLGMQVFTPAQRDAPSNMINNALCVNGMDKLRFSQDLALYNLELSDVIEGFDGSLHKPAWLHDPTWQGVRENVEQIMATRDWAEQLVATNLIYEPLVNELFRSHFVMQFAAPHGDYLTPMVVGAAEADYERNLAYTVELLRLLVDDVDHGAENRQQLGEWLAKWTPYSVAAARQLQPLWSQPKLKVLRFEDAYERSKHRFISILKSINVEVPKEVRL